MDGSSNMRDPARAEEFEVAEVPLGFGARLWAIGGFRKLAPKVSLVAPADEATVTDVVAFSWDNLWVPGADASVPLFAK